MSGLEVISDTEFKVTLSRPNSQFPVMVGYSGFADAYVVLRRP